MAGDILMPMQLCHRAAPSRLTYETAEPSTCGRGLARGEGASAKLPTLGWPPVVGGIGVQRLQNARIHCLTVGCQTLDELRDHPGRRCSD